MKFERLKLNDTDWKSDYDSINKLIEEINNMTGSFETKKGYCYTLNQFCNSLNKNPNEILLLRKKLLNEKIAVFIKDYNCKTTKNFKMAALKKFFEVNRKNNLEFPKVYIRYGRTTPRYIPTFEESAAMSKYAGSLKNQAIIDVLRTTGIRNSDLRAIRYGEVQTTDLIFKGYTIKNELLANKKNLTIVIYPLMKKIVPTACKGNRPYYVFTSEGTTETLKKYLDERQRKNGEIIDSDLLFPSDYRDNLPEEKGKIPMSNEAVVKIVKNSARAAGIAEWEHTVAHSLRKTDINHVINQPSQLRLASEDRKFLAGHRQHGSMEAYYDKTKIEQMRLKYSKMDFSPRQSVYQTKKMIVEESGIEQYLNNGWEILHNLPSGKIVLHRSY